ncbi:hypothetical protein [Paenibacillus xylaniclasticus]|uniref:hypothetical protein n=1 Tax=Paenibacillus xylaniclasticus TaxID=588083 RepID=UPI000FDB41EA|nr:MULTISPECIES: hypothetical protein [Paenibacillus]GFN29772.1 hypothetical protein PCURB6_00320 [Paenibacillus curdlanolyticus]
MVWSKQGIALSIAAALLLSAVPAAASPSLAPEADSKQSERAEGWGHIHGHGRHDEKHQLERLRYMANYFGIATDGKDSKQLLEEIKAAKKANPQKWESFKAEHRAQFEQRLKEAARYFNIPTEGKSVEQLHKEVKAARERNPDKWRTFIMEKRAQHDASKRSSQEDQPKSSEQQKKQETGSNV